MGPLLAALLLSAPAAAQPLPDCATLSQRWTGEYRRLLGPDWPVRDLPCARYERGPHLPEEVRDIVLAQAAWILENTRFPDRGLHAKPLIPWGGIAAPPENMLLWVAERSRKTVYRRCEGCAQGGDGVTYLGKDDFRLGNAMGLAGQLIHESRHSGHPAYGHVACTVPGQGTGSDCDATIAEDFDGGGSHAIGMHWMTWVATRSQWPEEQKAIARWIVHNALAYRINDRAAAEAYDCRYFQGAILGVACGKPAQGAGGRARKRP